MQDEENVELETPSEPVEETVEIPAETTEETIETPAVDVDALQATNKKLYERAKEAEAKLKILKDSKPTEAPSPLNVEELVLQATGMQEELLGELKAVATVRKISLIKAQNDPIFVAIKDKFEKDKKREDSSLPASRGAGTVKPKKDFLTPGLTREEHMAMVKTQS